MDKNFYTQFNELIKTRRSVFPDQYEAGKVVEDAIIEQILTNAMWAPNHGKTEPWKFTVFTGQGLQTLAQFQADAYKKTSGDKFSQSRYDKLLETPLKASHIIALQMVRTTTKNIPEIEDIAAVACAVQNLHLTVHAAGLGGYWTTGGVTYNNAAKPFFNLSVQDKLLGFFYIGNIAVPTPQASREGLGEKVIWIRV